MTFFIVENGIKINQMMIVSGTCCFLPWCTV